MARTARRTVREALRDELVYVGHAPALKDELSAQENLASLTSLAAEDAPPQHLETALAAVGLAAQSALPARVLSQGQRRRVHLAQLALSTRALWILDEPATALDRQGLAWLEAALSRAPARAAASRCWPRTRRSVSPRGGSPR